VSELFVDRWSRRLWLEGWKVANVFEVAVGWALFESGVDVASTVSGNPDDQALEESCPALEPSLGT
jgi:hypothetical protein